MTIRAWMQRAGILIASLLAGLAVRVWDVWLYAHVANDEIRDLRVVRAFVRDGVWPLLGPSASVGEFSLGPFFYYAMAPFVWALDGHVLSGVVVSLIGGVALIGVGWMVSRRLFGVVAANAVAVLLALNSVLIEYARWSWNPNLLPLVALVLVYACWRLWSRTERRADAVELVLIGGGLAVTLQLHAVAALWIPVVGVVVWCRRSLMVWWEWVLGAGVFVVLFVPLLVFEWMSGGQNTRALFSWVTGAAGSEGGEIAVLRRLSELADVFVRVMVGVDGFGWRLGVATAVLVLLVAVAWRWRSVWRTRASFALLATPILFGTVPLLFLRQQVFEHYVLQLVPLFLCLFVGLVVTVFREKKSRVAVLLCVVAVLGATQIFSWQRYTSALAEGAWEGPRSVPLVDLTMVADRLCQAADQRGERVTFAVSYPSEQMDQALLYLVEQHSCDVILLDTSSLSLQQPDVLVERWSGVRGEQVGRLGVVFEEVAP